MGINWGTPVLRQRKVERFDTPVCTMSALAGKGSGRKFSFNKAAQEALGLVKLDEENGDVSYVTFGKDDQNNIFVMSATSENPQMRMFKTNKSFSFSDKKTYEFITRTLGLSNSSENHLMLEAVDGEAYYKVSNVVSDAPAGDVDGAAEEAGEEANDSQTEEANEVSTTVDNSSDEPEAEVASMPAEPVAEETEEEWD